MTERGDGSEWARRRDATLARVQEEQTERERGYVQDTPLFALDMSQAEYAQPREETHAEAPLPSTVAKTATKRPTPGQIASAEAKLTLAWKRHERMVALATDPGNNRLVRIGEQELLSLLYEYERLADPAYYAQMQKDGTRP